MNRLQLTLFVLAATVVLAFRFQGLGAHDCRVHWISGKVDVGRVLGVLPLPVPLLPDLR